MENLQLIAGKVSNVCPFAVVTTNTPTTTLTTTITITIAELTKSVAYL